MSELHGRRLNTESMSPQIDTRQPGAPVDRQPALATHRGLPACQETVASPCIVW